MAYVATLCPGKSDFEAVSTLEDKVLAPESLGLQAFPSPVTVRQRLDEGADIYMPYVQKATGDLLRKSKAPITSLSTGHVALDVDVTPLDDSNTKKEGMPEPAWSHPREGKRVVRFSERMERTVRFKGEEVVVHYRMVVEVSERTTDAKGNALLLPLVGVDAWITSLGLPEAEVIALYRDHGTSEQFPSEMKGELDLERLPSGKFMTNALILEMGVLAYNVLRLMGQIALKGYKQRHERKRRRIRTVIQELLCVAARVVHHAGQVAYKFGRTCLAFDRLVLLRAHFCEV